MPPRHCRRIPPSNLGNVPRSFRRPLGGRNPAPALFPPRPRRSCCVRVWDSRWVFDWSVVVTSGVVSAVVGGVVSLATIHQLTVRRVRAEEGAAARRELSETSGRLKRELEIYSTTAYPQGKREDPTKVVLRDYELCLSLHVPATKSGRWRSRMNRRRLSKLFGTKAVEGVSMFRDIAENDESGSWPVMMHTQLGLGKGVRPRGEWHVAWCAEPGSKFARSAIGRLSRLERSSGLPW